MGLRGVILMFCPLLLKLRTRLLYSRCHPSIDDLPEDVMFNILSRLEVKTIINCKCVCKKWQILIVDYLVIPRSPQCLLIYHFEYIDSPERKGTLKLLEIENKLDHNHLLRDPFMSIDTANLFPKSIISTVGSVNGLICLWGLDKEGDKTYICNPITDEYITLPKQQFDVETYWNVRYGFGVSMAGEYKVIRFWTRGDPLKIEVYTLGTDKWRTLGHVPYRRASIDDGLFFNNHVHCIADDQLFSLNLDDETFKLSPLPPPLNGRVYKFLGVLKGCLSLFSRPNSTVAGVWVMKEYGIEKSWHKELEFQESLFPYPSYFPVSLIDGLNGRSLLFFIDSNDKEEGQLLTYCLETNTIEETTMRDNLFRVIPYRPSFVKLKKFGPTRVLKPRKHSTTHTH